MTALVVVALMLVAVAPGLWSVRPRGRTRRGPLLRLDALSGVVASVLPGWRIRSEDSEVIPHALELTARALRSGASVLTALDRVGTEVPSSGLRSVVSRVRGGLRLDEALKLWAHNDADRRTAAALLALGNSSGAAMAAGLDRAAHSLRQRHALGDEIRALTSQTRISAVVVAAAPGGFALLVTLIDRDALAVLVSTGVGWLSLVGGLALQGIGLWWMARLCRDVVRWA